MAGEVDQARSDALGEARNLLVGRMSFEFYFDYFEMMKANNELVAAGYVITDSNREDKYLEVVNSGDSDLLDKLKMYLDTMDRISVHNTYYSQYKSLKEALEIASSVEDVTTALDEFSSMFR